MRTISKRFSGLYLAAQQELERTANKIEQLEKDPECIMTELFNPQTDNPQFSFGFQPFLHSRELGYMDKLYLEFQKYLFGLVEEWIKEINPELEVTYQAEYGSDITVEWEKQPLFSFNIYTHEFWSRVEGKVAEAFLHQRIEDYKLRIRKLLIQKEKFQTYLKTPKLWLKEEKEARLKMTSSIWDYLMYSVLKTVLYYLYPEKTTKLLKKKLIATEKQLEDAKKMLRQTVIERKEKRTTREKLAHKCKEWEDVFLNEFKYRRRKRCYDDVTEFIRRIV